jgi:hypothetical protein
VLKRDIVNGQNAIRFDGNDDGMYVGGEWRMQTPATIFAVIRYYSGGATNHRGRVRMA